MVLEWKEEYSVHVKEIDDQHKQLVEHINELSSTPPLEISKKLPEVIAQLKKYSLDHFETEEKYFDKFNYDDAERHKEEHEKFKEKISEFKKKAEQDAMATLFEIIDFLGDWLVDHLIEMDQKYVDCFREHGLK